MHVHNILAEKGDDVAVIACDATISAALEQLAIHAIGALVVSDDGEHIDGILSERDIARSLREQGSSLLDWPVSRVMTSSVTTCGLSDTTEHCMAVMTQLRARHLPVVVDGRLAGIVSIGDIVKKRVDELENLQDQMVQFIRGQ